jgi:hypothetical protein
MTGWHTIRDCNADLAAVSWVPSVRFELTLYGF